MTAPLSSDDIPRLREQSQGLRKLAGLIGLAGVGHLLAAEAIDACLLEIERRGLKLAGVIPLYLERDPDEEKDSVRLHREKMEWCMRAHNAEAESKRLRTEAAATQVILSDPAAVWVNMLRGTIAKPMAVMEMGAEIVRLRALVGEHQ